LGGVIGKNDFVGMERLALEKIDCGDERVGDAV
jgi:hypothetical protein